MSRRLVAILVAIAFAMQLRTVIGRKEWGLATGFAAYARVYDDQFELVQMAKHLHGTYARDVTYYLYASTNARVEAFYYLDAPARIVDDVREVPSRCPTRACVLVVDLRASLDAEPRSHLAMVARSHRATLFDDHYLAIELTSLEAAQHAYTLEPMQASVAHSWFVNARRPPSRWTPGVLDEAILLEVR